MNTGTLGGSKRFATTASATFRRVCPECGKAFSCGEQWAYAHADPSGRRVYYCSYTCYRVWQRAREEQTRQRIAQEDEQYEKRLAYAREYERREQEQRKARNSAQARAEQCRQRIAHFAALAAMLPERSMQRRNAQENAARWRRKLALCEKNGGADDGAN